ncbi:MAG TPA: GNAT family N-acetyltransferase [Gemmatimonadales bacterium]|nr:GNAT family N-acetyltransferase [Gemmatimonadales bacterium]
MHRALALQRNESEPLGPAFRTGLTRADGLAGSDLARWHLLASHRSSSAPFLDPSWTHSWTEAFAPADPLLACAWNHERLVGLAAMQRVIEPWGGRSLAVLQSRTNAESYRFAFLSWRGRVDIQEELWRTLCNSGGCDVIRIEHVPDGSPTLHAARTVARELGWRCLVLPTFLTPWCPLSRLTAWDHGLTRKFRHNVRRSERRLGELGEVRLQVATGGTRLKQALDVFFHLEASGWKGRSGSAVAQRPQVRRFYDGLVDRSRAQVWIPVLTVSGAPVAAYVLRVNGRSIFALKTSYDESYSRYAPGQVLTARLIRYGLERGMEMFDFMADRARWKDDWASEFRPHYELLLFAPSPAGRFGYWVRYGLREHARKIPGALRLARWLRASRSTGR